MDNSVLQDLQDYYAEQCGLTLFICDVEHNLITDISGNNRLARFLLGDRLDLSTLMGHVGLHEYPPQSPLIYEVMPGLKSIISTVHTPLGPHFVWAGVFIESDARDLVNQYIEQHAANPNTWKEPLESVPELTSRMIQACIQRIRQLQSVASSEIGKHCPPKLESGANKHLRTLQNVLSGVAVPDSCTDELLEKVLSCDKRIQLVGIAQRLESERFGICHIVGQGASELSGCEFSTGEGFMGYTAATGLSGHWEDVSRDPRGVFFSRHGLHPEFVFCLPLKQNHQVTGILFGVADPRLDQDTLVLLEALAMALNIHHVNEKLMEDYQSQNLQLSIMTELSRTMIKIQDAKNVLLVLLDMSLNLVQGQFSCLAYKSFNTDSLHVMSRGITSQKAASYGQELADLYLVEESQPIHDRRMTNVRKVWDIPVLECQIFCHNHVVGVLAVAFSDEETAEQFRPLLSILSTLGTVGLQRLQNDARNKDAQKMIHALQQAMSFWNPSEYALTTEAADLVDKFARHIALKPAEVEVLSHAALVAPYNPELVDSLMNGTNVAVAEVLRSYHSPQDQTVQPSSEFSHLGAQILAMVFGHLRGDNKSDFVPDELKQKFRTFLLLKDTEMQEISLSRVVESCTYTERVKELTAREQQVLDLLVRGLGNKDIAQTLFISEHTVKNHMTNIFHKLGVTDRTQAIAAIYQSMQ